VTPDHPVRVVAISGSLRRLSSNGALVPAAARLAPAGMEVSTFESLAEIPPFNPDLDQDGTPEAVNAFRRLLAGCDALLISSPEYAHGVPGVLKNALDWIVGSGEIIGKPVALINTSPRSTHAWASLLETLTVMTARVIREASVPVPLQGRGLDADGIIGDNELATALRAALEALAAAVRASRNA
jgi:NAD(P)H-dependent FMN reductase